MMMKYQKFKKILLSALAILCCMSTGCQLPGNPPKQPEETTAAVAHITPESIPEHFSMKIPNGFTETSSPYYEKFYSCEDATIIITGEKVAVSGTALDDYVAAIQRNHKETVDAYEILDDGPLNIEGGIYGRSFEFTYAIIGEDISKTMHCLMAVFLVNDYAYVVTCKSYDTTFIGFEQPFRNALKSIRIDQQPIPEQTTHTTSTIVEETTALRNET